MNNQMKVIRQLYAFTVGITAGATVGLVGCRMGWSTSHHSGVEPITLENIAVLLQCICIAKCHIAIFFIAEF